MQPGVQAFPHYFRVVFHALHTDLNVTEVFEIHRTVDGGLETQAGLGL